MSAHSKCGEWSRGLNQSTGVIATIPSNILQKSEFVFIRFIRLTVSGEIVFNFPLGYPRGYIIINPMRIQLNASDVAVSV